MGKMIWRRACFSYRGFELSSDFDERVLVKASGKCKDSSGYWKSSYQGFESLGFHCISKI